MITERQMIIDALNREETSLLLNQFVARVIKSKYQSTESRKEAEAGLRIKNHTAKIHGQIWKGYSGSISTAPNNTEEQALGYEGRSAFLIHIGKYEECLRDVDRALKITRTNSLKVKLLCRKAECLVALNRSDKRIAWEKARFWLGKLKDKERDKTSLTILVNDIKDLIENGKPDDNIKDKKNTQIVELLSKKETESPWEHISIRYDNKYGRYLVAARDIEAGEIICVQKPYVMCSNTDFAPYAYCCHCLSISWDSIPCISCGWCLFCSEECRDAAWKQYHDIECSVMPRVRHQVESDYWKQISIRAVILAVREAGGIAQLRTNLEEVDNCTDECTKGFSDNGNFEGDNFRSLYSLCNNIPKNNLKKHIDDSIRVLFAFINCSSLFGEKKYKVMSEVLEDEDILFIGSLILKLSMIINVNCHGVYDKSIFCENGNNTEACMRLRCCTRGICLTTLFSLINNSCNPNAAAVFTDANNVALFALRPIKKNAQIFNAYSGTFYEKCKTQRNWIHKNGYNFTCDCPPCQNNWSISDNMDQDKEIILQDISNQDRISPEMYEKFAELIHSTVHKKSRFNQKKVEELGKAVETAIKYYIEPSYLICTLTNALERVSKNLYLTKLHITSRCKK